MKIGILTFANVPNFGANLQALSTVECLKAHGHEPVLIKWEPEDFSDRFTGMERQPQPAEHFRFVREYLPWTDLCRNDREICTVIEREGIEAVIIGSDAVLQCPSLWSRIDFPTKKVFRINKVTSERLYPNAFWGTFQSGLKNRIPMAIMSASSQNSPYRSHPRRTLKAMGRSLAAFDYISVRDRWTRNLVRYVSDGSIDPVITPDPVFAFNYNCEGLIPSKKAILEKFGLPERYALVSMKCVMLDCADWMDGLKNEAAKVGLTCVALPMPTGVDFKHTFDHEIATPLSPLDWYALIKYASAYIGENMHPVVVALHNAVPTFCFDTYGTLKFARMVTDEKSSKIYDIMNVFGVLKHRINAVTRFWKCPTPSEVISSITSFDRDACRRKASEYYASYGIMMENILKKLAKAKQ